MNDVPLVKDNKINDINTSIIAIKKQLKQLNEVVGLIDIPDMPDLSPYIKKSDVVDTVTSGDMHPITSNAVFQRFSAESTMFFNLPITDTTINSQCVLYYRKVTAHLVELVMIPTTQDLVVPNIITQIATLPEDFRPALFTFEANIEGRIKVGSTVPSRFTIDTNGNVFIVNYGSAETINSPYNTYFFSL